MNTSQQTSEKPFLIFAIADEVRVGGEIYRIAWQPSRGWDDHSVIREDGHVVQCGLRLHEARQLLEHLAQQETRRCGRAV